MAAVFANKSFTINDWRVDPELNRLSRADEVVKIDPQNMKVLELLASRPGEVISQSEIEGIAWAGVIVTPNSVYQSIAQLRRALGDDRAHPRYIETIARRGYRCVAIISGANTLPAAASPRMNEGSDKAEAVALTRRGLSLPSTALSLGIAALLLFTLASWLPALHLPTEKPAVDPMRLSGESTTGPKAAQVALELGDAALYSGHLRVALKHYDSALEQAARIYAPNDLFVAEVLTKKANAFLASDMEEDAREAAETAINILAKSAPQSHPSFFGARLAYGESLLYVGNLERSEEQILLAIEQAQSIFGAEDTAIPYAKGMLARLYLAQEQWKKAENELREVLTAFGKAFRGDADPLIGDYHILLARSLYGQERFSESVAESRKAMAILSSEGRQYDLYLAAAQQVLADSLLRMGEYDEAELVIAKCLSILRYAAAESWRVARAESAMGEVLLHRGFLQEAELKLMSAKDSLAGSTDRLVVSAFQENQRRLEILSTTQSQRAPPIYTRTTLYR
jgi:DNA-binding winged helix-turn-helix (wHTH) protein